MNRFIKKLLISVLFFIFANVWLISKGVMKGAADFLFDSAAVEETIIFILLQMAIIVNYFIYPLAIKKHKVIYWCVSEFLVLSTFLFWGIFIVGPIWLA